MEKKKERKKLCSRVKNAVIPIITGLLKPEEQKRYALLRSKITLGLLSPFHTQQLYMAKKC